MNKLWYRDSLSVCVKKKCDGIQDEKGAKRKKKILGENSFRGEVGLWEGKHLPHFIKLSFG